MVLRFTEKIFLQSVFPCFDILVTTSLHSYSYKNSKTLSRIQFGDRELSNEIMNLVYLAMQFRERMMRETSSSSFTVLNQRYMLFYFFFFRTCGIFFVSLNFNGILVPLGSEAFSYSVKVIKGLFGLFVAITITTL